MLARRLLNHVMCPPLLVAVARTYGSRVGEESFTALGTAFEHTAIRVFSQYGLVLQHRGGAGDEGVDFKGNWPLERDGGLPVSVIGQCKRTGGDVGPNFVRELQGVLSRVVLRRGSSSGAILGLLVSSEGFTPAAKAFSSTAPIPIALATIDEPRAVLSQLLLNFSAQELLPDLIVGTHYRQHLGSMQAEVALVYDGATLGE